MGLRRGTFQDIEQNIFEESVIRQRSFTSMPTLDSNEFEVAFRLDAKPDGVTSLFQDDSIFIRIEDGENGDRRSPNPNAGHYQLGTNDITKMHQ